MASEIVGKIRLNGGDKPDLIVRKLITDDDGRVVAKYGLTREGEWLLIAENESYPSECYLDAYVWIPQ